MEARIRPVLGVACVLAAAALWGTTGTAQALAGGTLPAAWFGALRLVFAAVFFVLFAALTGGLTQRAWKGLTLPHALGAGLCMAGYNLSFFAGVKLVGVGVGTAVALGSGPIWAGLLQTTWARQPPPAQWWLATAVAIAGGALLTAGAGVGSVSAIGIGLCLTAGLSYAIYALLNKRMVAQAPASTITLAAFTTAAVLALPFAAVHAGAPTVGPHDWIAAAYTGLVTAGLGYLLFSHALRHITPATGVTLSLAEPVVAFVLAALVLREPAGAVSVAAMVLVLIGVLGVMTTELTPPRTQPAPRRPPWG